MKRFFTRFFVVVGIVTTAIMLLSIIGGIVSLFGKKGVPGKTILEVNFEKGVAEYVPDDPIAKIFAKDLLVTRDVVDALEQAATDDRVVGLLAHIGGGGMGPAQIEEIREAVKKFREAGKIAVAYSETFGEFGPGNGGYYLATAFDEIYLQPSGDIGLIGLRAESPFFRGTLDKLKIKPQLDHRHEYKNAMNTFTEKKYTEPHREALAAVLETIYEQMLEAISEGRGMARSDVRALVDRGPFLGTEALEAKLVDGLAYRDEIYARMKEKTAEDAKFLYLHAYLKSAGRPHDSGPSLALIYGVGAVQRGESDYDAPSGDQTMGSQTVTAAFRAAVKDETVKAIIFRVDSPGGSYVASDAIWRETIRAKEAGKPVIVTMGNVAGSGGYFVAMAADKIVAQPSTITGSIGVLGGKFVTTGFWEKFGVTYDAVQFGENAAMWSTLESYNPAEYARFQAWLDRVYADFTQKVADGRNLPLEKVQEVAKGRIWSGRDAKSLGLVDELGGFSTALRLAKEAAGIDPEVKVNIKVFPKEKTPLQHLLGKPPRSSEPAAVEALTQIVREMQPVVRMARQSGMTGPPPGVLKVPFPMLQIR